MSPMSLFTLDAKTLQQVAERDERASPCGERAERWMTQAAMVVIGATLLIAILV